MRISDLSSDVCSSDLRAHHGSHVHVGGHELGGPEDLEPHGGEIVGRFAEQVADLVVAEQQALGSGLVDQPPERRPGPAAPPQGQQQLGVDLVAEAGQDRSEEHTSELQSLMRLSYAVFCLTKKTPKTMHRSEENK